MADVMQNIRGIEICVTQFKDLSLNTVFGFWYLLCALKGFQQNTLNRIQYHFKRSAWRWLYTNEPKYLAVKYDVKYL